MHGKPVTQSEIDKIVHLRKTGHSLPEIRRILKRGNSTVYGHIKNVEVLPGYRTAWEIKRGANKRRSDARWIEAEAEVIDIMPSIFNIPEQMLIASCLYWGEGAKRDFSFTNSDPKMIEVFTRCLEGLGIKKDRLRVSIRIYEDINQLSAVKYWSSVVGIEAKEIKSVNILKGKKVGKLEFGMCRVRVSKGQDIFKRLQSAIKQITVRTMSS
jgi:hypothetical protein